MELLEQEESVNIGYNTQVKKLTAFTIGYVVKSFPHSGHPILVIDRMISQLQLMAQLKMEKVAQLTQFIRVAFQVQYSQFFQAMATAVIQPLSERSYLACLGHYLRQRGY